MLGFENYGELMIMDGFLVGIYGAVSVVSTLICSSLYVFGLVDIFVL